MSGVSTAVAGGLVGFVSCCTRPAVCPGAHSTILPRTRTRRSGLVASIRTALATAASPSLIGRQSAVEHGRDVGNGGRILAGDVEVLTRAVHQVVRPDGVSVGEDQGIRRAKRDHVCQKPHMQLWHIRHTADQAREAGCGKASSHTVRTVSAADQSAQHRL